MFKITITSKAAIILIALTFLTVAACDQQGQNQTPIQGQSGRSPLDYSSKINSLTEIIKQNPKNLNAQIQLGNAYMDTNQFQKAITAYSAALAIDPKLTNVRADLGTCHRRSGRPDLAAAAYKEVIKIDPTHVNAHKNLGVVLAYDLGDNKGAVVAFERYLELAPADQDAPAIRAEIQRLRLL